MNFVTSRKMIRITKFKTKKKIFWLMTQLIWKWFHYKNFCFFRWRKKIPISISYLKCVTYTYIARACAGLYYIIWFFFFFIWCLERQPFCIGEKGDPPPLVGNLFFPLGGRFSCHFDCRRERTRPKLSRLPLFKSTPQ